LTDNLFSSLGRQYALKLAELGARVVVNDLANPQAVVDEIKALGGQAVADEHSVEDGDKIVETALGKFGGLHILINNAGILRDKSFQAMTDDLWSIIQAIHLRGTYKTLRAAWPIFLKQGYGRIVNTTSVSGIYGNFGQSNYAAAKCGVIGLSTALANEGKNHNIRVNTVAPSAGTQLTRTIMPEEIIQALKPDYVAPFVVALLSDSLPGSFTDGLYEIGSGCIAADEFQRTSEQKFTISGLTPESLLSAYPSLVTPVTYVKLSSRRKTTSNKLTGKSNT
jgi:multifunctional beta-oxidation protein